MPVSWVINGGTGRPGLTRVDHLSSMRRPLKRTAPISRIASFWESRPVVSISRTTSEGMRRLYHPPMNLLRMPEVHLFGKLVVLGHVLHGFHRLFLRRSKSIAHELHTTPARIPRYT